METLLGIGIVGLIVGVSVWITLVQQRKAAVNLRAGAERLGLKFTPAAGMGKEGPRAEGPLRGREVRFWSYETGSGKHRKRWVALALSNATQGRLLLTLQPQGFNTKVAELFGAREIELGDSRFDATWFVRTSEPTACRAALTPEIRGKLNAARDAGARGTFSVETGLASYREEGGFHRAGTFERLEGLVPLLEEIAVAAEVSESALAPA
jgi:hypothetical protein